MFGDPDNHWLNVQRLLLHVLCSQLLNTQYDLGISGKIIVNWNQHISPFGENCHQTLFLSRSAKVSTYLSLSKIYRFNTAASRSPPLNVPGPFNTWQCGNVAWPQIDPPTKPMNPRIRGCDPMRSFQSLPCSLHFGICSPSVVATIYKYILGWYPKKEPQAATRELSQEPCVSKPGRPARPKICCTSKMPKSSRLYDFNDWGIERYC